MKRVVRGSLVAVAVLAVLWLVLTVALFAAMLQPPDEFGQIMARVPEPFFILFAVLPFERLWNVARGGDLEVGDPAPDFDLETVPDGARVRLSDSRGARPVVLVFGSFT
jgi:hypothetical protein